MLCWPALVRPARPRVDDHPGCRCRLPLLLHDGGDFRMLGQPSKILVHRHLQNAEDFEIPIHRMRVGRWAGHGKVIKAVSTLARIIHSHGQFSPCHPCEKPAAKQTLKIEHPIESASAHFLNALENFEPIRGRTPALTLEAKNTSQVRIIFEQRNKL